MSMSNIPPGPTHSQGCSLGGSHPQLSLGVSAPKELPSEGSVKRRRAVGEGGEEKEDWRRAVGEGGEEKEDWRGGESPFILEENKTLSLLASPRLENYLLPI